MNATYEQRLRLRVGLGGPEAVAAAVALLERHDPDSLEQALELVADDAGLGPRRTETLTVAWDHYFHIKAMSWD